jgi:hypothetical protein
MKRTRMIAGLACALLLTAGSAFAGTVNYGWEDGGTALGVAAFSGATPTVSNSNTQVNTGSYSLQVVKGQASTEYVYLGWIKGLQVGDTVTASFWVYDTTPSTNPSGRIWSHYDDSATDVMVNSGSGTGPSAYSGSSVWSQTSYTYTVAAGHTGMVIEGRVYGAIGSTLWFDDLSITAPDTATVLLPAAAPVPEPSSLWSLAAGLTGLLGLIRKQTL